MDTLLPFGSSFSLDLAFNSPSDDLIESIPDEDLKFILSNPQPWEEALFVWLKIVRDDVNKACPKVIRKASEISMGLQFTDDFTIAKMNKTWRKQDYPTDVLSFPIIDKNFVSLENKSIELGDIIISVSTAKRQAQEMRHDLAIELRWLVTHGLLHLLGWEHPNPKSLEEMLTFQNQLITNGVGSSLLKTKLNPIYS